VRLTRVALVAVSVGLSLAAGAAQAQSTSGSLVPRPVMFDDQVMPTGCGCNGAPVMEPSCGCDGRPACGCQSGGCDTCGGSPSCGGCSSCGGCDCACDACCGLLNDCCELGVRFRAEFLPMTRTVSNRTVVFDNGLSTDDFSFTYEWGVRAAAEVRVGCDCSAEVVYMGQQRWRDDIILDNPAILVLPETATYVSELFGGEVNFWCPLPLHSHALSASFMFGTRYLDLREHFDLGVPSALVAPSLFTLSTRNHIVAGQLGWMLNLDVTHCFSIRWEGRAGVGGNLVERETNVILPATLDVERRGDNVAFVGDTNVVLSYQLTRHLSAYAGYYVLFTDGLALAPQQFTASLNDIDHSGSVFFQAGMAGFEVTW